MDNQADVFAKTRELSECIMRNEIYLNMKAAEDRAMANEDVAALVVRYTAYDEQIKQMMIDNDRDFARLKKLNAAMTEIKDEMTMYDELNELANARQAFSALMQQVNAMLKFLLVDSADDIFSSCDKCASCGGCEG